MNWIDKLSERAEKDKAALNVADDSALGRFANKMESRADALEGEDDDGE